MITCHNLITTNFTLIPIHLRKHSYNTNYISDLSPDRGAVFCNI